jgi:hypothetical protein
MTIPSPDSFNAIRIYLNGLGIGSSRRIRRRQPTAATSGGNACSLLNMNDGGLD